MANRQPQNPFASPQYQQQQQQHPHQHQQLPPPGQLNVPPPTGQPARYYDNESEDAHSRPLYYNDNGQSDPYGGGDSDVEYGGKGGYAPSSESLFPPSGRASEITEYQGPAGARESYPAWSQERNIPLSKEEIEDIFLDLTQKFGFQRDSMRNMVSISNPFYSKTC